MTGKGLCIDVQVAWLNSTWWDELGSTGQGVYVSALMWSMGQLADGEVPKSALRFIAPDSTVAAAVLDQAVQLGRMEATAVGWRFLDWAGTQGQTTAEDIRANRDRRAANERARRGRARTKPVADNVAGHVADHVEGHVSKGKTGQGRASEGRPGEAPEGDVLSWPTRQPGTTEWKEGVS